MKRETLWQAYRWLLSALTPVVLVLTAVRLLLTPAFIRLEYRMPGFPPDPFGFTQADRLHWAEIARQYLLNDAGIEFLGNLRFADGSPVYNARELRHMADVKRVVRGAMLVWWGSLALMALGVFLGWRFDKIAEVRYALARGGLWTMALLAAIVLFVLVAFNTFFVAFHRVFFEGNTWLFLYSDTLIRLFPERFWQDAFLAVGGLALLGGAALYWGLRSPRSLSSP